MDTPELSVYSEAKAEYTRQLSVFLIPTLETYFLDLLQTAKEQSPSPQKALWQFQNLLQSIPDWNQDKVIRETERIQEDSKCDYLEELLTAVFIAHTKVLSAIRLTTKQNKLQITIPKIDHFLHRVLTECARSLWTNAFLFADTTSIEKQKNLRQVELLLKEAILQAIRGMLPVKKILREYLHNDDEEEEATHVEKQLEEVKEEDESKPAVEESKPAVEESKPAVEESKPAAKETQPAAEETQPAVEETQPVVEENKKEETQAPEDEEQPVIDEKTVNVENTVVQEQQIQLPVQETTNDIQPKKEEEVKRDQTAPMIFIDTKPSVSFQQSHTYFSSDTLEGNQIQESPFAEAELKPEEDNWDDEIEQIEILDEELPMDAEELTM